MEIYNYWVLEKLNIEFKDFSLLGSFEVSKVSCYKIREFWIMIFFVVLIFFVFIFEVICFKGEISFFFYCEDKYFLIIVYVMFILDI